MIFQAHEILKGKNLEKQGLVFKISLSSKNLEFLLGSYTTLCPVKCSIFEEL